MAALPPFLEPLFWDVDFKLLMLKRDASFIIARVAEYGTDEAVRWLRQSYADSEIGAGLETERHALSDRTVNLWRLWLKKPEDWCKNTPSRPLKGVFWKA